MSFYMHCVFLNNCVSYIAYDRIYSCHDILDLYLNKKFDDRSKIFKKYWKLKHK